MGIGLALIGSILMFLGWVLAIVPGFRGIKDVAVVIVVAIIGFGVVLIPAGMDLFLQPAQGKRNPAAILISVLPSAILFLITVFVIPMEPLIRVLAIVVEVVGVALYVWAWRSTHRGPSEAMT